MKTSLTALVLAAAASISFAQDKSTLDKADKNFIEKAAAGGMLEVQWGRLAESKAQSPEVKAYAATLVKDHSAANDELKALAQSKGVSIPTALPKHEQGQLDKLGKAKNFDHEFLEENVDDHKKDVKDFEKASQGAKDPEVKAFAAKTLPTLKSHLQQAESLQKSLKGKKS
jgi:putative membrane protein